MPYQEVKHMTCLGFSYTGMGLAVGRMCASCAVFRANWIRASTALQLLVTIADLSSRESCHQYSPIGDDSQAK